MAHETLTLMLGPVLVSTYVGRYLLTAAACCAIGAIGGGQKLKARGRMNGMNEMNGIYGMNGLSMLKSWLGLRIDHLRLL